MTVKTNFIAGFAFLALLSSCKYQRSSHQFYYHGTDPIGNENGFFYVEQGVTGESRTTYKVQGGLKVGGNVREGLVADAKRDMAVFHPLGPNQMYANLSIDIVTTETGVTSDGLYSVDRIDLQCTISADIIQYGVSSTSESATKGGVRSLDALPDEAPDTTTDKIRTEEMPSNKGELKTIKPGLSIEVLAGSDTEPTRWVEATVLNCGDGNFTVQYKEPGSNKAAFKTLSVDSDFYRFKP